MVPLIALSVIFPDVVVVKLTVPFGLPPAAILLAIRFAAALLRVIAPSVVVADVIVKAPPPDCANVIGALAPIVARLLAVVAPLFVFAMLIAAAPAPLVAALRLVVCVITCVVLPMPVTAVAVRGPAVISVPAPLP